MVCLYDKMLRNHLNDVQKGYLAAERFSLKNTKSTKQAIKHVEYNNEMQCLSGTPYASQTYCIECFPCLISLNPPKNLMMYVLLPFPLYI